MGKAIKNTTNHTHQDCHCYCHDIDLAIIHAAFSSTSIRCCLLPATVTQDKDKTLRSTHVVLKSSVPSPIETDRRRDVDAPGRTAQHNISTTAPTSQAYSILLLTASTA